MDLPISNTSYNCFVIYWPPATTIYSVKLPVSTYYPILILLLFLSHPLFVPLVYIIHQHHHLFSLFDTLAAYCGAAALLSGGHGQGCAGACGLMLLP